MRIAASGICRSDLSCSTASGPMPTADRARARGRRGDRGGRRGRRPPTASASTSCSRSRPPAERCRFCLEGRANLCTSAAHAYDTRHPARRHHPPASRRGARPPPRRRVVVRRRTRSCRPTAALAIDDRLDLGLACLLGCGVTTGVCSVTTRANVRPGDVGRDLRLRRRRARGRAGGAARVGARRSSPSTRCRQARAGAAARRHPRVEPSDEGLAADPRADGRRRRRRVRGARQPRGRRAGVQRRARRRHDRADRPAAIGVRAGFPVYDVTQFEHTILGTNLGGAVPALDIPQARAAGGRGPARPRGAGDRTATRWPR